MPTATLNSRKEAVPARDDHPAGHGLGELGFDDLAERRGAAATISDFGGNYCTLTLDCMSWCP
jgi:hypothetical protein